MPWCVKKCPYCDFNSHAVRDSIPENEYINQLINEITVYQPVLTNKHLNTIFIGGGTPSLINAEGYERLFKALRQRIDWAPDCEVTLEANPGTLEQGRFEAYHELGINRLSIGVQSLNNDHLRQLGRIHDRSHALSAISSARNAGFNRINVDIMYALPQQSPEQALVDLQQAIDQRPDHISWYQLTLEPNTLFHHQPPTLPSESDMAQMEHAGKQLLAENGFEQYEVSAFAKSGQMCRHNLNYWQFGDYLGIGAGAHSKLTDNAAGKIVRHSNVKHPKAYLQACNDFIQSQEVIETSDLPFEYMLNHLRLMGPIDYNHFEATTGLSRTTLLATVDHLIASELASATKAGFELTLQGRNFLNDCVCAFLPTKD